jgi:hypothetical protein
VHSDDGLITCAILRERRDERRSHMMAPAYMIAEMALV